MNQVYADSIAKAKSYYKDFLDVLHDLSHSERVAKNAVEIAKSVGYKDTQFIELCAFWHDVAQTQKIEPHHEPGAAMMRDDLLARGASQELSNKAYEATRLHSHSHNPRSDEGKIIRDADMLDFINLERWQKGVNAKQHEHLLPVIPMLKELPDGFSFDISKKLYSERLPKFWEYYESIKSQLPAA